MVIFLNVRGHACLGRCIRKGLSFVDLQRLDHLGCLVALLSWFVCNAGVIIISIYILLVNVRGHDCIGLCIGVGLNWFMNSGGEMVLADV